MKGEKMEMEKQVCNLELSKRLKELGVQQEALFFWAEQKNTPPQLSLFSLCDFELRGIVYNKKIAAAFNVAELGEMLPRVVIIKGESAWIYFNGIEGEGWYCGYGEDDVALVAEKDDTMANAAAKMLIYLIENKLVMP